MLGGHSRRGERADESNAPGALAAAGARPLPPLAIAPAPRGQAPGPVAAAAPHRLLMSGSPGHDGACLRIEGGRFAGAEIHVSVTGSHVELAVLTPHEASRETLAIAMEAVKNRLRTRGLTMSEAAPSPARPQRGGHAASGDGTRFVDSRHDRHDRPTL